MKMRPAKFTHSTANALRGWLSLAAMLILAGWSSIDQSIFVYAENMAKVSAEEIVERADRIRFPTEGFQVDVKITMLRPDENPEEKKYRVLSKGKDSTVLMTLAPAIDKGNILLMREQDLWAFLPNLSQPVRLPLSQKLTGEVANGDLARANFSGDYDASILRNEKIDDEIYYVLELSASRRGVTYHRVLYWVNQSNYWPWKAEFYSRSNRLLKTCHYQDFKEVIGEIRPTRLLMIDAMNNDRRSIMDYSDMKFRDLPDKIFTKQYLKKLKK